MEKETKKTTKKKATTKKVTKKSNVTKAAEKKEKKVVVKEEVEKEEKVVEKKKEEPKKEKKEKKEKVSIIGFLKGVKSEMSKVVWPSKRDMVKYSIATLVFIIFFAVYFEAVILLMAYLKDNIIG